MGEEVRKVPRRLSGVAHLRASAGYSISGIRAMLHETAFRHELICGVLELPLAWLLPGLGLGWRVGISLLWLTMPAMEMVNTAIEAVVDLVSPEYHPLAGKAKDLGSAAVFCTICANVFVWLVVAIKMIGHLTIE